MKTTDKEYLLVYMAETDGEIKIEAFSMEKIRSKVKGWSPEDYAIINGTVLKNFDTKNIKHV